MTPRQFAIKINTTFADEALLKEIHEMLAAQLAIPGKGGTNWVNELLSRISIENASKRSIVHILRASQKSAAQLIEWQNLLNDFHAYLVKYCDDFARTLNGLPYPGHDAAE